MIFKSYRHISVKASEYLSSITKHNTIYKWSQTKPLALTRFGREYTMGSSGVPLSEIVNKLDSFAPTSLAEKWDNVGLLIEPATPRPVKHVLLTNDLTEDVMLEAVSSSAELIVSYHPPIFSPLKRITGKTWKERIVASCLENRIALYSPHTSFDAIKGGVNDWLAEMFDTRWVEPLQQSYSANSPQGTGFLVELSLPVGREGEEVTAKVLDLAQSIPGTVVRTHRVIGHDIRLALCCAKSSVTQVTQLVYNSPFHTDTHRLKITKLEEHPLPGYGMGRLCQLTSPLRLSEVASKVKKYLGIQHVQIAVARAKTQESPVSTVALCAGSGSSVLQGVTADLYLTGEMSHHDVLDATQKGIHVLLCHHSNTERGFLSQFAPTLSDSLGGAITVAVSQQDRDPLTIV